MRLSGIVLDLYDDPNGLVLRDKLASRPLPVKLAGMAVDPELLVALPDRLFGLVAVNEGMALRKYAMHDAEHLATSVLYFLECGHLLPESTQEKVAANLINGCSWYDMDPPAALVKRAGVLGTLGTVSNMGGSLVGSALESQARRPGNMASFRAAQAAGIKAASGTEVELSLDADTRAQEGDGPESGYIWGALGGFSDHAGQERKLKSQLEKRDQVEPVTSLKLADVVGSEAMPQGGTLRTRPGRSTVDLPAKTAAGKLAANYVTAGWIHCGDLTHLQPAVKKIAARHDHFAFPDSQMYPIDTVSQVKQASDYFDTHFTEFTPVQRRVFSYMVSERATELGVKIAGRMTEYSGTEYGPFVAAELTARIAAFEGTGRDTVYEMLRDKIAEIEPAIMAEMLREADTKTGASEHYGRPVTGFRDPFAAVYGVDKFAAESPDPVTTYSWNEGSDYVSGLELRHLAQQSSGLERHFGRDFADHFAKDPVGVFKSLPSPNKVTVARLAAQGASS